MRPVGRACEGGGLSAWPFPSVADNVRAQKRALACRGIDRVDLVVGWSMGGMQAFAWHALFPDAIGGALAVCATPEPSAVNRVFLEGIRRVLVGAPGNPRRRNGPDKRPGRQALLADGAAAFRRRPLDKAPSHRSNPAHPLLKS